MVSKDHISSASLAQRISAKLADYRLLVKFRLTSIVVFSAAIGYILASGSAFSFQGLWWISIAGFLITGAANALNEIIEKDYDKLMKRTANRPLPSQRMSTVEALLLAGVMGVGGTVLLAYHFNNLTALIGAVSMLSYAFIYTPLKRISNIAVFVGAIPGALPPMIGWVAFTGTLSMEAFILFSIQFLWQFPHFWAIAWVAHDDYQKAGFKMLPADGGQSRTSAFYNILYIAFLIPVSLLPFIMGYTGWISAVVIGIAGFVFLWQAYNLYMDCSHKAAKQLMFGSFFYLPIVFMALVIDKL